MGVIPPERDEAEWRPGMPAPDLSDLIRRRQRGRAIVMGLLLGALVLLIFFVTIAKIRTGNG